MIFDATWKSIDPAVPVQTLIRRYLTAAPRNLAGGFPPTSGDAPFGYPPSLPSWV